MITWNEICRQKSRHLFFREHRYVFELTRQFMGMGVGTGVHLLVAGLVSVGVHIFTENIHTDD